jgi:thioredoxin reductase
MQICFDEGEEYGHEEIRSDLDSVTQEERKVEDEDEVDQLFYNTDEKLNNEYFKSEGVKKPNGPNLNI